MTASLGYTVDIDQADRVELFPPSLRCPSNIRSDFKKLDKSNHRESGKISFLSYSYILRILFDTFQMTSIAQLGTLCWILFQ